MELEPPPPLLICLHGVVHKDNFTVRAKLAQSV